jgi:hypothetical protein
MKLTFVIKTEKYLTAVKKSAVAIGLILYVIIPS